MFKIGDRVKKNKIGHDGEILGIMTGTVVSLPFEYTTWLFDEKRWGKKFGIRVKYDKFTGEAKGFYESGITDIVNPNNFRKIN